MNDARKLYSKQYRIANREKINKQKREYRLANKGSRKDEARRHWLKSRYKMTTEDYDVMLHNQNGCCAICGKHWSVENRTLHIDHNHSNGNIRGLLCRNCNTALGLLNEDSALFDKAKEYLKKNNGR